jgi:hypothetical protein
MPCLARHLKCGNLLDSKKTHFRLRPALFSDGSLGEFLECLSQFSVSDANLQSFAAHRDPDGQITSIPFEVGCRHRGRDGRQRQVGGPSLG